MRFVASRLLFGLPTLPFGYVLCRLGKGTTEDVVDHSGLSGAVSLSSWPGDSAVRAGGHCHIKYILMRTEKCSHRRRQTVGTVSNMA